MVETAPRHDDDKDNHMGHYDIEQGKAVRQQAAIATDFVTEYLLNHSWSHRPGLLRAIASGAVGSYLSTGMVMTKHLRGQPDQLRDATYAAIAAAADEGLLPSHA